MCKLFISTGPLSRRSVHLILEAANEKFAHTERDGFGFVAMARGQYARGRYLQPGGFTGFHTGLPEWLVGQAVEENSIPVCTRTLIAHGRTSTNAVKLGNVHPFMRRKRFALAHNGVVYWTGKGEAEPPFSCDSEQFFDWFMRHGWNGSREAFAGTGAIAIGDVVTGSLTVARDSSSLYIARRADHKGWFLATMESHLLAIVKASGIKLDTKPLQFPNLKLVQFVNSRVTVKSWEGFGIHQWTALETRSMGDQRKGTSNEIPINTGATVAPSVPQGSVDDTERYRRYYRSHSVGQQLSLDVAERRQIAS